MDNPSPLLLYEVTDELSTVNDQGGHIDAGHILPEILDPSWNTGQAGRGGCARSDVTSLREVLVIMICFPFSIGSSLIVFSSWRIFLPRVLELNDFDPEIFRLWAWQTQGLLPICPAYKLHRFSCSEKDSEPFLLWQGPVIPQKFHENSAARTAIRTKEKQEAA